MRLALKFPGLSPAAVQLLCHVAIVFLAAFGTALIAGVAAPVSMPALLALLYSAAAAGLTAVIHYVLGLVPSPTPLAAAGYRAIAAVPLAVKNRLYQVVVSVLVTFSSIFGAALVAGALHVTSLPSLTDLVVAAISAGVAGAVQAAVGLVPAPTH